MVIIGEKNFDYDNNYFQIMLHLCIVITRIYRTLVIDYNYKIDIFSNLVVTHILLSHMNACERLNIKSLKCIFTKNLSFFSPLASLQFRFFFTKIFAKKLAKFVFFAKKMQTSNFYWPVWFSELRLSDRIFIYFFFSSMKSENFNNFSFKMFWRHL